MNLIRIGRKISYLLRHNPEDLSMDKNGWVDVKDLLRKLNINLSILKEIVETNDKKRYVFNGDHTKIRALQGHSIEIEPILNETVPPEYLYHGTSPNYVQSIMNNGLSKMRRQHVHLSEDKSTAYNVGKRHSKEKKPIILIIKSSEMYKNGHIFYKSDNGVWLTDNVPLKYIIFKSN